MKAHHERWAAAVIIGLYLILGGVYSVVVPIFEASDELRHYPVVKYIADGNGLPVQHPGVTTYWEQEGSQPPLYYATGALLTAWINTDDFTNIFVLNPHARIGIPLAQDNKNMLIHSAQEAFPWHGTPLAVHLLRFYSLLLGAGTVYCTYRLTRNLLPTHPSWVLGATALNAFIPMYLFISASVNNDNLIVLLSAITLLLLVRLIQQGIKRYWLPAIGLLIGAACLTKLSGLALIPLAIIAIGLRQTSLYLELPALDRVVKQRKRLLSAMIGSFVIDCLLVVLSAVLVAGWWYLRNGKLYGELLGTRTMLAIIGGRTIPITSLSDLVGEFRGFRYSFWGLFGAVNILMRPIWIYYLLDVISIISIGALVWRVLRSLRHLAYRSLFVYGFLVIWIGVFVLSILRWTSMTMASQGRLLFVALPAICFLFIVGLHSIKYLQIGRYLAMGLCVLLFLLAVTTPFVSIHPAYTPAPALTVEQVPATAQHFGATYGGVMRLLATEIGAKTVDPGSQIPVTLYWQVVAPMSVNYSIYIHISGLQQQNLGQRDSYPGEGLLPTTALKPGQIIRDRFLVPVSSDAQGPVAAQITVGLYQLDTMKNLAVVDEQGQSVDWPVIGRVRIATPTFPSQPQYQVNGNLGDRIRLVGYDLVAANISRKGIMKFTLYWEVNRALDRDYTVFVHLVDSNGQNHGSGDGPPLNGTYPSSFWTPGDWLTDPHQCTIDPEAPEGTYQLEVGLYDPATGQRLPIIGADGQIQGDSINLATITVTK